MVVDPDGAFFTKFGSGRKKMATHITSDDPVAVVRLYIDAFNKGDAKAMAACFASS